MENFKSHAGAIIGTITTWFGIALANRETVTFWLQSISLIGAIAVSAVTIWSLLRNKK